MKSFHNYLCRQLKGGGMEIDMCKALDDLYQDGVETGLEKGENRYSQLILKLSELGLTELLVKAASDSDYRDSLYMKYNIK